jgi:L-fuculose-phosphate aldolase
MHYALLHPRDQIVMLMARIYAYGMTTTSGGNLSLRDDEGGIWISPAGVDKANLTRDDIVCVRPDGTVEGRHRPSSEYPFHKAVYDVRPDARGIVHAHPTALVAFSIVRKLPDTRIIAQAREVCGTIGLAPYALPGSDQLGAVIADKFGEGCDSVVLENHGVVCCGDTLWEAFRRFETLDFCARLIGKASNLGRLQVLSDDALMLAGQRKNLLPEYQPAFHTNHEKELRREMSDIIHRAYEQRIMTSTEGTLSARLAEDTFLITPYGVDRKYLDIEDLVVVEAGRRQRGKIPSRSVVLHRAIYRRHPDINSIVTAQGPNSMAFGVTDAPFNTRTIPESYVLLRDIPKIPFGDQYTREEGIAEAISAARPVVLIENDALLATGASILQAFDRLEVAEFTARSVISALPLGTLVPIDAPEITDLEDAFGLPPAGDLSGRNPAGLAE